MLPAPQELSCCSPRSISSATASSPTKPDTGGVTAHRLEDTKKKSYDGGDETELGGNNKNDVPNLALLYAFLRSESTLDAIERLHAYVSGVARFVRQKKNEMIAVVGQNRVVVCPEKLRSVLPAPSTFRSGRPGRRQNLLSLHICMQSVPYL